MITKICPCCKRRFWPVKTELYCGETCKEFGRKYGRKRCHDVFTKRQSDEVKERLAKRDKEFLIAFPNAVITVKTNGEQCLPVDEELQSLRARKEAFEIGCMVRTIAPKRKMSKSDFKAWKERSFTIDDDEPLRNYI